MSATLRLPNLLRADAEGQSHLSLDLPPDCTLAEAFNRLALSYPRLERRIRDEQGQLRRFVNVYLDGDECRTLDGLSTKVPDRAEIQVLASVAGG